MIFYFLSNVDILGFINWKFYSAIAELVSLSLIMVMAFKMDSGVIEKVRIY